MGQRLICRKCNEGLYSYAEPERKDWSNRKMKCERCGFEETLKEFTERAKNTEQDNQPDNLPEDGDADYWDDHGTGK